MLFFSAKKRSMRIPTLRYFLNSPRVGYIYEGFDTQSGYFLHEEFPTRIPYLVIFVKLNGTLRWEFGMVVWGIYPWNSHSFFLVSSSTIRKHGGEWNFSTDFRYLVFFGVFEYCKEASPWRKLRSSMMIAWRNAAKFLKRVLSLS